MTNFRIYLTSKGGITEEQFLTLTQGIVLQQFEKGQYILRPGEICKHAFFIEQGLMRSFSIGENGKEHIIQFAPENWIISDRSSAFFNEPSDYFIEAVEDTTAVLLDKKFIQQASLINATFRAFNEQALQNHIRHMQQRINLLLGASAEKRYLDFINLYPDLTLRVPQWMIASYLGITPESLSRVRKELAKRNFK
ncbi:MAG: Crp/Fnr family transcriptional regulator [Saprospiraceae bacterium]|nr:Crp/Fnr family transcriptional regulator [Saprospiraceae bacterium]